MKRRIFAVAGIAAVVLGAGLYFAWPALTAGEAATPPKKEARPTKWAQPIEKPGLPNLHRVAPCLYRGAQPTAQGMAELKKMGVKTVVNLRKARTPVFFHCKHGADRTGTMCAVYRIAVCGWSKDEAIAEMTQGGFGYHTVWTNLIKFIRKLDVEDVKRRAGRPHSARRQP